MTFQPTTPAEARAAVAFTKSGSIKAGISEDELISRNRDCILCEMAVAKLWSDEAGKVRKLFRHEAMREQGNNAAKAGAAARTAQAAAKREITKAAMLSAIASGTTTKAGIMQALGLNKDSFTKAIVPLMNDGKVSRTMIALDSGGNTAIYIIAGKPIPVGVSGMGHRRAQIMELIATGLTSHYEISKHIGTTAETCRQVMTRMVRDGMLTSRLVQKDSGTRGTRVVIYGAAQ